MNYFYIDGDDVGLRLEQSLLNNDEASLKEINVEVSSAIRRLTSSLERLGCEMIFSGADGVIGKSSKDLIGDVHRCVCSLGGALTFSIGVGLSLRDAFAALRYAKASGKNGIAILGAGFHWKRNSELAEEGGTIACTEGRELSSMAGARLSRVLGDS